METFKWVLVGTFTVLMIFIIAILRWTSKRNKEFFEKEGIYFISFNTKAISLFCLYFICVGKIGKELPELFKNGNQIYHFLFNDITFSVSASIIATFLFLWSTYINDLRKSASDIGMTRIYLEQIIEKYFGNINFDGKILKEYFDNKEKIDYKKILKEVNENKIESKEINCLENISENSLEIDRLKWIHWLDTTSVRWWFNFIISNSIEKYNNKRAVFLGTLNCIIEIDKIMKNPIIYVYMELL